MFIYTEEKRKKAVKSLDVYPLCDKVAKSSKPLESFYCKNHDNTSMVDFESVILFVREKSQGCAPILKNMDDIITILKFLALHQKDVDILKYDSIHLMKGQEDLLRICRRFGSKNHGCINITKREHVSNIRDYIDSVEEDLEWISMFKKGLFVGTLLTLTVVLLLGWKKRT